MLASLHLCCHTLEVADLKELLPGDNKCILGSPAQGIPWQEGTEFQQSCHLRGVLAGEVLLRTPRQAEACHLRTICCAAASVARCLEAQHADKELYLHEAITGSEWKLSSVMKATFRVELYALRSD